MGINSSTQRNDLLKRSNVKLQAQKITSYDGNSIKWHSWNKKMKAAVGTAGLLRILESEPYAKSNAMDNETIFHLLQVATADGHAAHLVDMYEDEKDGYSAYQELVRWFEGDELTTETAEDIRSKMDKLSLSTKNTASQYINQFLQHKKHLEELKEEYTPSKTVNIFLTQITDHDFSSTVEHCLENRLDLKECIERIRAKERRLDRERTSKRKFPVIIRRMQDTSQEESKTIKLDDYLTERGYYSIPHDEWFNLSDDDKSYVKAYNGKKRNGSDGDDGNNQQSSSKKRSRTYRPRRTTSEESSEISDKNEGKRQRTVQFREHEPEHGLDPTQDKPNDGIGENRIIQRRGALRFRMKGDDED